MAFIASFSHSSQVIRFLIYSLISFTGDNYVTNGSSSRRLGQEKEDYSSATTTTTTTISGKYPILKWSEKKNKWTVVFKGYYDDHCEAIKAYRR